MTWKSRFFRFFRKKKQSQKALSGSGERRFLLNKYRFSHSRSTKKRVFWTPKQLLQWVLESFNAESASMLSYCTGNMPERTLVIPKRA